MNLVTLIGNICSDPTQKAFENSSVVNFRLAVDGAGNSKDDAGYFDIACWNKQGEAVMEYCSKGSRIAVEGKLRQRRWETKDGGEKRSAVEVGNARVTFLNTKRPDESTEATPAPDETKPAPAGDDIPF